MTTPSFGTFFLPGPTEVRPEILAAMQRPMISHRSPEFEALYAHREARATAAEKKTLNANARQIEAAADVDLVGFLPLKALQTDTAYVLRGLLRSPLGQSALAALEKRGIIPPAQNHRMQYGRIGAIPATLPDEDKQALESFVKLLDSAADFALPADGAAGKVRAPKWPAAEAPTRSQIRRVCRALVKTGIVRDPADLVLIETSLGVPLAGALAP